MLKAQPKSWALQKDAILDAKDLNNLPLEELLGSLLAHKLGLQEDEEQGQKNDKRRGLALKSKVIDDSEVEERSDSDDEKMAMYARKFRRFIKKTSYGRRTRINIVKMNQRRSTRKNRTRTPRKTTQSFATTATSLVISNKTANFPKSIQST